MLFSSRIGALFLTAAIAAAPLTSNASTPKHKALPKVSATATPAPVVHLTTGDMISVRLIGGDMGSRISNEGDTFAVVTTEDYYFKGQFLLPKGTPGYGEITHIKRAGMWHAGGELRFTVKRLVAPDGTTISVETNGATADADKASEKNGNEFGQYLLFGGLGIFTHRGNDILIKDGAMFHVAISQSTDVPVATYGIRPARLDWNLVTIKSKAELDSTADAQAPTSATPAPSATAQP